MQTCELSGVTSLLIQQDGEHDVERVALAAPDNSMIVSHVKALFLYHRLDTALLLPALRATLAHYPIFLGRLERSPTTGRWTALLNNAGARYVLAKANHSSLLSSYNGLSAKEDILDENFIPGNLFCDQGLDPLSSDSPVLAIQVTEFEDGAVAVGVCAHHVLVDGPAFFRFVHQWSDAVATLLRQNEKEKEEHSPTFEVKVCHDRELLKPKYQTPKLEHPEYALKEPAPYPASLTDLKFPPCSFKNFRFRRDDLERLKEAASKSCSGGEFVSTNDALTALFFQAVTRARNAEKEAPVKLGYAVDGRPRLPFLPEEYCGNATFFGFIDTTADRVLTMSLDECSKLIRKTTDSMTTEYLQDALAWVESQEDTAYIFPPFWSFFGNDFAVSNWVKSRLYKLTFGQEQEPFYAGIPPVPFGDGLLILVDGPEGDGITALLALRKDHMQVIENDPLFRAFCPRA
ncbi:hypothetical protein QOT17_014030 [Balamuthia mandrillaris]